MRHFTIDLYEYFGLTRNGSGGILTAYIPDRIDPLSKRIRPAVVVIPGGAYHFCSEREKEPVALKFMANGFAAFTLEYSTDTAYPIPLYEAMMAIAYLRENQEALGIDKIAAVGFSAGGHLTGLLATATEEEIAALFQKRQSFSRPDAVVLCYPVVTLRDGLTHPETRKHITGNRKQLYEALSLENRVGANSAPAFIWHTVEDDAVPAENSWVLASAYRKCNVPFALHLFEKGRHGLSLANIETDDTFGGDRTMESVGKWMELALDFLNAHGFDIKVQI